MNRDLEQREAIGAVANIAQSKKEQMENLKQEFEEKWGIGLWWDSKVSENDKRNSWWFNRLSLIKVSNREEIIDDIKKYLLLYEEIEDIKDLSEVKGTSGVYDAYSKIKDLYYSLDAALEIANREKDKTTSSAVFNLHTSFISQKRDIQKKVERVELAFRKENELKLEQKLHQSVELNKTREVQIENVVQNNRELKEDNRKLREDNEKFKSEIRDLVKQLRFGVTVQIEANSQQQDSGAQSTNDSNVHPTFRSRSSSLSSSSAKDGDQPGPSSKLSEMSPISRSQSLSSLCSNNSDSDIEVISRSQCR